MPPLRKQQSGDSNVGTKVGVKKMNAADLLKRIRADGSGNDDDDTWGLSEEDIVQPKASSHRVKPPVRARRQSRPSPKSQAAPPKASGGAARLSTLGGSRESSTVNRNDVKKKPVKSNTISFSLVTPTNRKAVKKSSSLGWIAFSSGDDDNGSAAGSVFRLASGGRESSSASSSVDGESWNWDGSAKSKSAISDWTSSWKSGNSGLSSSPAQGNGPKGSSEAPASRRDFSSWGGSWAAFVSAKGGQSGDTQQKDVSGRGARLSDSWNFADSGSTPSFGLGQEGDYDDTASSEAATNISSEGTVIDTPVNRHPAVPTRADRGRGNHRLPRHELVTQVVRGARVNSPARKSVGVGIAEFTHSMWEVAPCNYRQVSRAQHKPTRGLSPSPPHHHGVIRSVSPSPDSAVHKWDWLSAGWSTQGEVKRQCHHDCDWMNPEHHHWPHGAEGMPLIEGNKPLRADEQQEKAKTEPRENSANGSGAQERIQRERFVPRPVVVLVSVDPSDGSLTTLGRMDWSVNGDERALRRPRDVCDLAVPPVAKVTRGRTMEVGCERSPRLDDSLEREHHAKEGMPGGGERGELVRGQGEGLADGLKGSSRGSNLGGMAVSRRGIERRASKQDEALGENLVTVDSTLEEHFHEVERFERRLIPCEDDLAQPSRQSGAVFANTPSAVAVGEAEVPTADGVMTVGRRPKSMKWYFLSIGESSQGFVKHHVHKDAALKGENGRSRSASQRRTRCCGGYSEKPARTVPPPNRGARRARSEGVVVARDSAKIRGDSRRRPPKSGVQQEKRLREVTVDAYRQPDRGAGQQAVYHYRHVEESEVTEAAHPTKVLLQSAYGAAAVRSALNRMFASKHRDPKSQPSDGAALVAPGNQQTTHNIEAEKLPSRGMAANELHQVTENVRDAPGVRSYSFDEEVLVEVEFNN